MSLLDRAIAWSLSFVPRSIVGRFSRRYIAGTQVDDALETSRSLRAAGARVTLDILGEFIETLDQATRNTAAYRDLLRRIEESGLSDTNVSVKLTALGLLLDHDACRENLRMLLRDAADRDNFVRLDMEDSSCTDGTLTLYREMRREFPGRVGCVLQSRLRRTLEDVESLIDEPLSVRLCKGIYLEPRSIAYTDPDRIREKFVQGLDRLFAAGAYVGIATHDEILVREAERLIRERGVRKDGYEFQMLLGVLEGMRATLIDAGHPLRVYVPYGKDWYAYSVRRLKENPQIAGHAFRAFFRRSGTSGS